MRLGTHRTGVRLQYRMSASILSRETALIAIYLGLTISTCLTTTGSLLRGLSSHGKTLESHPACSTFVFRLALLLHLYQPIPKHWFLHFYLVGIVSTVALLPFANSFAAPFVLVQVLRRCYECLHVHDWRPGSKMYLPSYLVGLVQYILLPVNLLPSSSSTTTTITTTITLLSEPMALTIQWTGAILCLYCQYEQHRHHSLLAKQRHAQPNVMYVLPAGRWFDRVGSPQYFMEVGVYVSFLLMMQTRQAAALLLWVASNQILNSWRSHLWYRQHFQEYKKQNRKAIIPFLL